MIRQTTSGVTVTATALHPSDVLINFPVQVDPDVVKRYNVHALLALKSVNVEPEVDVFETYLRANIVQ